MALLMDDNATATTCRNRVVRRRNRCKEFKTMVGEVIHGKAFQFLIVILACLEGILVVTMLMLEVEKLQSKDPVRTRNFELAKFSIECISLSIVSFFVLEIVLKVCIFGLGLYLHSFIESIDAVVILVSFGIDVYLMATETKKHPANLRNIHSPTSPPPNELELGNVNDTSVKSLPEAAGFLLVFRLWRVVRIANAILVSVSTTQENKIKEMKAERDKANSRVSQLEEYIVKIGHRVPSPEC